MLGQTLLGQRLADLRSVLDCLRTRSDLDATRLALWGDSTGAANPDDRRIEVPLDVEQPARAEPLGGLMALLGILFHDEIKAAYVHAGLSSYQSVLQSPFVHLPHDAIVPGALTVGDLADVAAALAPRPLWLEGLVDGRNCRVRAPALARTYEPARQAYAAAHAEQKLQLAAEPASAPGVAGWLRDSLSR
jgi:hypothetical protein